MVWACRRFGGALKVRQLVTVCAISLMLALSACSGDDAAADDATADTPVASIAHRTTEDTMPSTSTKDPGNPDGSLGSPAGTDSDASEAPSTTVERPDGPLASMVELTGGKGVFMGEPLPTTSTAAGYVEHEYAAAGTATSYKAIERAAPTTVAGRSARDAPRRTAHAVLVRAPARTRRLQRHGRRRVAERQWRCRRRSRLDEPPRRRSSGAATRGSACRRR